MHEPALVTALSLGTAAVWLVFGLLFKVLDLVPRHRRIVAGVLGERWAKPVTRAVGCFEALLGCWILSGRLPLACILVQTVVIAAMNTLEIARARRLLLAPLPMVAANSLFLLAGWYLAVLRSH